MQTYPRLEIQDSYGPLSEHDLDEITGMLSDDLPKDYRQFLLKNNGGSLPAEDRVRFIPSHDDEEQFPCDDSLRYFLGVQTGERFNDIASKIDLLEDNTSPPLLLPIARLHTDNLLWLSVHGDDRGHVYCYDMANGRWSHITESFQRLIDGLDVSLRPDSAAVNHPAFDAAIVGNVEWFKTHGSESVNVRNGEGNTPLMEAAWRGRKKLVEWLVENATEISLLNNRGWNALYMAVAGHNLDICGFLLAHGANPNVRDVNGDTPLEYAIKNEVDRRIIALLRESDGVALSKTVE